MRLDPFELAMLAVGVAGAAAVLWLGRPALLGGRGRLPKRFEVSSMGDAEVPLDARKPLAYLSERLQAAGFVSADLPVRVPSVNGLGRRLLLVPFVHPDERALFIMGIESRLVGASQIMLHIITPLAQGRRVETSTLPGLEQVVSPPGVSAKVVLDASTVEEIWSRHRLALNQHERGSRIHIDPGEWRRHAAVAYEAWLQSGVRAQRLTLAPGGEAYQISARSRPAR